ncbi:MAG: 50S ribosomal protein L3, partial [Clostridia bacterium]|nr:50S ribosomal protein L3 [Clostridia bacterium]
MNKAIIGKKLGMTQVFTADGAVIPVTVVEAGPCAVVQKKTVERDGYTAVQLGYKDVKESKLNKPELGHLKKANAANLKHLKEFKLENADALEVGATITCDVFAAGDFVDVTGTTKGHGFSGVIKRWNQRR